MTRAKPRPRDQAWQAQMASGVAELSTSASIGWLEAFYAAYDRAFVLPDEKEGLEGFRECLALNEGDAFARLSERYGSFAEVVAVARDATTGEVMGGANFIAFAPAADSHVVTANLNYIFVEEAFRRRGVFRDLVDLVKSQARSLFATGDEDALPHVLVFIEMNDPLRMAPEDYELDSQHAGLDQVDRLRIWARLGAQLIDFDYGQPALSADQEPDDGLLYGVVGARDEGLSACRLKQHLERFFAISVLKGRDPMDDAEATRQITDLTARCRKGEAIRLLDLNPPEDGLSGAGKAGSYLEIARRR